MLKRTIVLTIIGVFLLFSGAVAATLQLPRTGQTLCYDATGATVTCSGTGQDGEYQLGVAWPAPRFAAAGDCVTDNLTGLMWVASPTITITTWQGALNYANNLDLCGYQDWRLPNVNELESLIHTGEITTSAWLNTQGFSGLQSIYWTSTTRRGALDRAWLVSLQTGQTLVGPKTNPDAHYAIAVRGTTSGSALVWRTGQTTCYDEAGASRNCAGTGEDGEYQAGAAWPEPRFVVGVGAEEACITDQLTDLMWLRTPNITTTTTWQDALNSANILGACGYSDWRIPNRNEFRSLSNYGQPDLGAWLEDQGFVNVPTKYYWSSTTRLTNPSGAFNFNAYTSALEYASKASPADHGAWAVRGPTQVTPIPNIIVDPTAINFGSVILNNPSTRTVTITNSGTANLEVSATSTTSGLFTVSTGGANPCSDTTPTLVPAQSCTLVVTFTPTAIGPQSANLNIVSNDPDTATAQVALTGTGTDQNAPDIAVDRTAINFGSVTVGESSTPSILTITSQGTADLVISQANFTGTSSSMFSVAPGGSNPCDSTTPTIPFGTSCTLAITFAPTASGAQVAYFNITSNDPDSSLVTIPLSGTGVDEEVTPSATEGTLGTEITYSGSSSGFGDKKGKVLINGLKQKVSNWSNTSVKVIVKKVKDLLIDTPYNVSIQWKPKGSKTTNTIDLPGAFTLRRPEINALTSDTQGIPGADATVRGMWFGSKKGKVYVGEQKCKVKSWVMDTETGVSEVVFVVNSKIVGGRYLLKVENKVGKSILADFFDVL